MIDAHRPEATIGESGEQAAPPGRRAMDWEAFFGNYRKPDFVPGFTILNKLGSGVFGEVYKAKRTSIGKLYAIKFLRLQDERLHEQVVRELDTVDHFAQVDHPNLVSIEDRGEVCGIPYIIMGYAGDETLKTLLRDGPMSVERAGPLFRQVVRGVKALHDHSIIHFDLKPANIFIKGDVARVGDYGLSKLMTESRATLSMGRGTPHYMAPEMLQRRGDGRSDVYSLGVILFEMLVGDVPFKGETEWEILRRHETETPAIPESIPGPIRALLKQSLGKDPATRFVNAGAMLNAFEAALGARGTSASPQAGSPAVSDSSPPPVPRAASCGPSRAAPCGPARAGAVVGRLAGRGKVTIEKVRGELQGVLENVRQRTEDAYAAARRAFDDETEQQAAGRQAASDPEIAEARSGSRVRGNKGRGRRWSPRRLLSLPITIVGWAFRNAARLAVVAAIIAGLCGLIHLGLEELIL